MLLKDIVFSLLWESVCDIELKTVVAVYSNSAQEHLNTILYTGFVEELVDILELKETNLTVSLRVLFVKCLRWLVTFLC